MINQIIFLATQGFCCCFCVLILLIATSDVPGPGSVAAQLGEAATLLSLPGRGVTDTRAEAGPVAGETEI